MPYNPNIFKAYDIRGVYGIDFDNEFAFKLGGVLVKYLNRKKILVARDNREFSPELAEALMQGIIAAGGDPQYLRLSTVPLFNFVFGKIGAEGGVMVTASHNPPEFGGFKVYDNNGDIVGLESGLAAIKDLLENYSVENSKYGGKTIEIDKPAMIEDYVKFIINKAKVKPGEFNDFEIRFDVPESATDEMKLLRNKVGLKLGDGKSKLAFSFDSDGDRLLVFDHDRKQIKDDFILGLLVRDTVRFLSKPRVVYDLRFSRGVISKFNEWGIKSFRSRVGRAFAKEMMKKHKADIGGELSGHFFFKENNYNELPPLAMLRLLKILIRSKMTINEMIRPFESWQNSGEINFDINENSKPVDDLFSQLEQKYSDGEIEKLDGLSVSFSDWWFNLRASNTEPVIRLVVEAKIKDLLDEKVGELKNQITGT